MLGALISGGVSLIGGLLGKSSADKRDKKAREQWIASQRRNKGYVDAMNKDVRERADAAAKVPIETTGGVDMDGMLAAAKKAGINPLTYIQAGGLQAWSKSTTTGSTAMDAALAGSAIFQEQSAPAPTAPGMGEVLGSALGSFGNQLVAGMQQQQQNNFQMQMLNAQLQGANRYGTGGQSRSGYVPTAFLAGTTTKAQNGSSTGGGPLTVGGLGGTTAYGANDPLKRLNLGPLGVWELDPLLSAGQAIEDAWGEGGLSWLATAGVVGGHILHNIKAAPLSSREPRFDTPLGGMSIEPGGFADYVVKQGTSFYTEGQKAGWW